MCFFAPKVQKQTESKCRANENMEPLKSGIKMGISRFLFGTVEYISIYFICF